MSYRLLLDIEAVEFMAALPRREQLQLRRRLGEIQAFPSRLHCGFAIYFWDDFADRHGKVFRLRRADASWRLDSRAARLANVPA